MSSLGGQYFHVQIIGCNSSQVNVNSVNPSDLNCSWDELDDDYSTVLSTVGNN